MGETWYGILDGNTYIYN